MVFEFRLPDLGEGITEGEIVKWRVVEGESVEEHQIALDVETDKAIVEVPSPRKGKVVKINRAEGDVVRVGEALLEIEVEGRPGEEETARKPAPSTASVVGRLSEEESVAAVPKARALARKLGVDLSTVVGTGPGGVITEDDVRGALAPPEARAGTAGPGKDSDRFGPIERVPIKGVRKSITRNLLTSQRTAAFVTGMEEADVTDLWDLRQRESRVARNSGVHLTFMPFFIKAVQRSLLEHPMLNGSVDENGAEIIVKKYYNIGVAVDTPDGLMVSVIKNADKKTVLELASELQGLAAKARERKITLDELKGSTFTISNYGPFGGTYATPIINYPEIAILGTGRIREKPWVKDGAIVIRKILPLSLTFDHRVIDGSEAARFLADVVSRLEDPAMIMIEGA
ncbi:MAG: 2-oxo acid dehydrogenase subunit E2 [Deltaproteobacteria bacterium]|nr:2-oxo acid dehydrogenase subunit E2 [Deltaproteobacteria bacterium]